jgi:hypothetical protein
MSKMCGICTKNAKGIQNVRKTKEETSRWEGNIIMDLEEVWESCELDKFGSRGPMVHSFVYSNEPFEFQKVRRFN